MPGDLTACGGEAPDMIAAQTPAAERVEHDADSHAGRGPLNKRSRERLAGLPRMEDIALERDRTLRAGDRRKHLRIELRTVFEPDDPVAPHHARRQHGRESVLELA